MGEYTREVIKWNQDKIIRDKYPCGIDKYCDYKEKKAMISVSVDMEIEINGQKRIMANGEYVTRNDCGDDGIFASCDNLTMDRGVLSTKDGKKIEGRFRVIGPTKKDS